MKMFNASLEDFEKQFDSRVFVFKHAAYDENGKPTQGFIEIPDHLIRFVEEALKDKGVFVVPPEMSDAQFEAAKRKALISYLNITLRERIVNFLSFEDDQRKKGASLISDPRFERAKRWTIELREALEQQAPIDEELSFLPPKKVTETKTEAPSTDVSKKRGRPARAETAGVDA